MEKLIRLALGCGFDQAAALDVSTLEARSDVRAMCAADKCRAYGKNWTCPPHCGTLEECQEKMASYSRGILVQTVGKLRRSIDWRGTVALEQRHLENFHRAAEEIRRLYPDALCLGAGGCRICEKCAFPEPCRFPERACPSMEGCGLFVTDVCRKNGMQYHYGNCTLAYTACFLF